MSDTFITPGRPRLTTFRNNVFTAERRSFPLAPLGGMSAQSGAETVFTEWVKLPADQSSLDLTLEITELRDSESTTTTTTSGVESSPGGATLEVTVQTCRKVDNGNAVDPPRVPLGGEFGPQETTGTVDVQCLVLQWVRLQVVVSGVSPTSAFTVSGTGVPLGLV